MRSDLAWLRSEGWEIALARHLRYGGKVIGLCGGFQMLGNSVSDPNGIEGNPGTSPGFGLLDIDTTLEAMKTLERTEGTLLCADAKVSGYEIHMGVSRGPGLERPAVRLKDRKDGAVSVDGQVLGTYLHGLFDEAEACAGLLAWAGLEAVVTVDYMELRQSEIDRLADSIEQHLDTRRIFSGLDSKLPA